MVAPNTSASGGPLLPSAAPAPLEGAALQIFLQNWIAPLTTLDPTLVRPRWQPEPDNIPEAGDAWCALGIVADRESDTFPYQSEDADGLGTTLQRNEQFSVLCSFYDTGSTGLADYYSTLLKDNLAIVQNTDPLTSNSFALAYVGKQTQAPALLASRWLVRMDLPVVVRRLVTRVYPVESITSANGTLVTDEGETRNIVVLPPTQSRRFRR